MTILTSGENIGFGEEIGITEVKNYPYLEP